MLTTFLDQLYNTPIVIPFCCLSGSIIHIMVRDIIKFQIFNIPCKAINDLTIKEFNNFGLYFGGMLGITRFYCGMSIIECLNK